MGVLDGVGVVRAQHLKVLLKKVGGVRVGSSFALALGRGDE